MHEIYLFNEEEFLSRVFFYYTDVIWDRGKEKEISFFFNFHEFLRTLKFFLLQFIISIELHNFKLTWQICDDLQPFGGNNLHLLKTFDSKNSNCVDIAYENW